MEMRIVLLFAFALGLASVTNGQLQQLQQLGQGIVNPCGPNQSLRLCGPVCPALCANLRPLCDMNICIPGCFCNPGYIRLIRSGPCVKICPVGGPGLFGLG